MCTTSTGWRPRKSQWNVILDSLRTLLQSTLHHHTLKSLLHHNLDPFHLDHQPLLKMSQTRTTSLYSSMTMTENQKLKSRESFSMWHLLWNQLWLAGSCHCPQCSQLASLLASGNPWPKLGRYRQAKAHQMEGQVIIPVSNWPPSQVAKRKSMPTLPVSTTLRLQT